MNVIHSARFGPLQYDPQQVITFPKGIPGFDTFTQYILLPLDQEQSHPFYILHSVEDGKLSFMVLDTLRFFPSYEIKLADEVVEELQIEKPEDVLILSTVTVRGDWQTATTNLKAPLVINTVKRLGQQVVLDQSEYLIKQPLFEPKENNAHGSRAQEGV